MIQNAFYFTSKALLILKILKLLSFEFLAVSKNGLNKYFKIYNIITWLTNNCNTYIDQYLKK